jgi:N-acetylmuramic acid 6-phosphate (MurNAc-6-P) etherase
VTWSPLTALWTSDDEIERALAATDCEVKNAILALLADVDGLTAARLLAQLARDDLDALGLLAADTVVGVSASGRGVR